MKWLYSELAKHTQSMKHLEVYANKELNIIQNSSKTLKEVDIRLNENYYFHFLKSD